MLTIGAVSVTAPVVAAPMAGITNAAYRILARESGAGFTYTEMISDKALLSGNAKTRKLMAILPEEGPVGIQLLGGEPSSMAKAARLAEEAGAALIDINMGCPVPKVVRNGEGARLLTDPGRAESVVRAVVAAVSVPVTVKMRSGWDDATRNAAELARRLEAAGAAAITVHGRTRSQGYSGPTDWRIIAAVKRAVSVPVIGNGDVDSPEAAARMLSETGVDAVMVARASLGNPWLFGRIVHHLRTGELLPSPGADERIAMAWRHFQLLMAIKGERLAVQEMRRHAAWYLHGVRGAALWRRQLNHATSRSDLANLFGRLAADLGVERPSGLEGPDSNQLALPQAAC